MGAVRAITDSSRRDSSEWLLDPGSDENVGHVPVRPVHGHFRVLPAANTDRRLSYPIEPYSTRTPCGSNLATGARIGPPHE
jgi:hypothetical protein